MATCFTPCTVTAAGLSAFSVSRAETAANAAAPGVSQILVSNCNNDYVIIPGGYDPAVPLSTATNNWDRYCGERLNPLIGPNGQAASVTVCSKLVSQAHCAKIDLPIAFSANQAVRHPLQDERRRVRHCNCGRGGQCRCQRQLGFLPRLPSTIRLKFHQVLLIQVY